MSKRRNRRTRNDPFFAKLVPLGGGRFFDPEKSRVYVDSHDMDEFLNEEAMLEEWENTPAAEVPQTELPPEDLRQRAAHQELETMWRIAKEKANRARAALERDTAKRRARVLRGKRAFKRSIGSDLVPEDALELHALEMVLARREAQSQNQPPRAGDEACGPSGEESPSSDS